MSFLGSLVEGAVDLYEGYQNRKESRQSHKRQLDFAREDRVWNAEQAAIARSETDRYARAMLADQFGIMAKGAREAGYHPLAALGAPPQSSPGTVIPGQSNLGSIRKDFQSRNLGKAAGKIAKAYANQEYERAVIDNMNADTALKLSEASRNSNPGRANPHGDWPPYDIGGMPIVSRVKFEKMDDGTEMVEAKPNPNITTQKGDKGTAAGSNPMFSQYDMGYGMSLYGMYSEEGPADSFPVTAIPVLALKNAAALGAWLDKQLGIDNVNYNSVKKLFADIKSGRVKALQARKKKTRRQSRSLSPIHH